MQDFGDAFEFEGSTTPDEDEAFEEYGRLVDRRTLTKRPADWAEVYTIAEQQTDPGVLLLMLRKLRPADTKYADTHRPLAQYLCKRYGVLAEAAGPAPLGESKAPPVLVEVDWPAFVKVLLKTDGPERLAALPASMLPADADVQAQATAFVHERTRSLADMVESRMLSGASTFGLELQDLDGYIAEVPDPALVGSWLAGLVTTVPTELCGDKLSWKAIGDGTNLEFVTEPTNNRYVLTQVVTEICAVHALLRQARPGLYRLGDRIIGILDRGAAGKAVSGGAQPQFNVDVPLDRIIPLLLELAPALDEPPVENDTLAARRLRYTWLFGVTSKFWHPKRINEEMRAVVRIARAIDGLDPAAFAKLVPQAVHASPAKLAQVRGHLLLVAMCANHRIFFDNPDLPKDMPLLPKTNLAELTGQLCDLGDLTEDRPEAITDVLAFLDKHNVIAGSAKKPAWYGTGIRKITERMSATHHPLERVEGLTPRCRDGRFEVVLEFRRVGILPVEQWVAGAQRAFDEFVADQGRRYA